MIFTYFVSYPKMGVMHLKAAVLFECGKPLNVIDGLEIPQPNKGQVLVLLSYSGVCHSQIMEIKGARGPDNYLPHLLGHEGSGKVLAVGEGVTKVTPGDEVILGWIKGSGLDVAGPKYRWNGGYINAGAITTFNTHAIVSENRCVKVPPGMPLEIAALLGCAVPTGAGMIFNELNPELGSSLAVFGIGGIGSIALMAAKAKGCHPIIAIDVEHKKLDAASRLGATNTINANEENVLATITSLTNGRGLDFAVDAAGKVSTIEQAFKSLRFGGGKCVFASHPPKGEMIALDPHDLISGKQIKGSWGGGCCPDRDSILFADLYMKGKLDLNSIITNYYSLDEINYAVDDLASGKVLRPIIRF